jgi:hypothetical protein
MNKWFVAHAKDCWLSMKVTAFSVAGIAVPKLGVKLTESIDSQGVEELASFRTNEVMKATFIERCGMRVQFVANAIKETFCTLICSMRYLLSLAFKWVNFCRSHNFDQISFHEFFLFSGHLTCTFNSVHGIINPKNVTLKMVQE